jgi:hypothetical protein
MRKNYKFRPEIVKFIINSKLRNPDLSCRKLALEVSQKFNLKFSKSAINNILKIEKLSSPVGRRSPQLFHPEGERSNAGFYILKAMDEHLQLSLSVTEVLLNNSPSAYKAFRKEIKTVVQALILFKAIFDVTLDFTVCYNNKELWQLIGRRPSRAVYNRIVKMFPNLQLVAEELVREIRQRLTPIIGFRFRLRNENTFFIDAGLNSIWPKPINNHHFVTTYYKADSYVNEIIRQDKIISVFNSQDINIFSEEVLNFITSFDSQDLSQRIRQIELLGPEENIVATKAVTITERRFFLLGFWPWQLDMMSEFERKAATQKFVERELGVEYYYQIEELTIPQHLVNKEVRLMAIILKNSPLAATRIGILTNLPADVVHNFLSYKELYQWYFPEERYRDFLKKTKDITHYPSRPLSDILSNILQNRELDNMFSVLSKLIWEEFQYLFLENPSVFSPLKMKNIFSQQKAVLKPSKESLIHNFIINNELWQGSHVKYTCQRLNEAGIKDEQGRLLWFR